MDKNEKKPKEKESFQDYRKEMKSLIESESARRDHGISRAVKRRGEEASSVIQPAIEQQDLVVETDMLQVLAEQAGLPFVHLSDYALSDLKPLKLIPARLARDYKVFPLREEEDGSIVVAICDPLNITIIDDLRLLLDREISPVVASEDEIMDYIDQYYGVGEESIEKMVEELESEGKETALTYSFEELDLSDIERIAQDPPIIQLVNLILLQAIKDRASDLHIEPFSNTLRIRYRVDGALKEISSPPRALQLGICSRIKVMAHMDISETRLPQDGRIRLTIAGREIDLRVSTVPTVYGESIVMRILDKSMMLLGIDQLGFTKETSEKFRKILQLPNGIILVTGPTGCGKTTTLYAALQELNDPGVKIITTEDPVEFEIPGLIQVNINPNVGLTFARCLRSILRQDPDIILVGEIRDLETAQISVQASLTGHLVFSTLHTNSAAATITRLLDMGVEPFLITSTLEAVIGQRLVRLICPSCKRPYQPTPEELADFGATPEEVKDIQFFKGEGCENCGYTGYLGRIGIFELMILTEELRELILERASTETIHNLAVKQGMKTMRQDGWLKICMGLTTFEEVARQTPVETPEIISEEMEETIKMTKEGIGDEYFKEEAEKLSEIGLRHATEDEIKRGLKRPTPYDTEAAQHPHLIGDAEKTRKNR
ncbi:type II secretion system ATPase GspE [Candidatus Sumerlaeota bacterium]|nr:type II secretion system ATPase GspE [Candidatus Sumerlaeota bacterium]